ncbi:unnamed protein product [Lactuca saligna]|uniref:Uncharacterized protein n=1 Tax=Lactuca saligna TaxID=75948 RepID=A0AA35ZQ21_LACSI|nr:unnamed protein product [Lactuca saligna]
MAFHENVQDPIFPQALVFRLGGDYCECSLVEFSWRIGLYKTQEVMTPKFVMFLREATQVYENGASGLEFWNNTASVIFNSGVSPESNIRSPIYFLVHRFITFSMNHRRHEDKFMKQNLFFLWCILQPGVCCNIPHFLACFLADSAASPRPGSPICGGYFITRSAHSYGLVVPNITRSLTFMEGNNFTMGYLETLRVVRNYGSHWGLIEIDDEGDDGEQPGEQSEQQPQPRHQIRNVRGQGERGQPMHHPAPMREPNFGGDMAKYFYSLSLSVNWIGGTVENLVQHLHVEQPPHLGYHYPICSWLSEYRGQGGDGAGTSGAQDEEYDD